MTFPPGSIMSHVWDLRRASERIFEVARRCYEVAKHDSKVPLSGSLRERLHSVAGAAIDAVNEHRVDLECDPLDSAEYLERLERVTATFHEEAIRLSGLCREARHYRRHLPPPSSFVPLADYLHALGACLRGAAEATREGVKRVCPDE